MLLNNQLATQTELLIKECPVCASRKLEYEFIIEKNPVCRCRDCSLMFLNPQPEIDGSSFESKPIEDIEINGISAELYKRNTEVYLDNLIQYCDKRTGKLLIIGTCSLLMVEEAEKRGFVVEKMELADFYQSSVARIGNDRFDACILYAILEKSRNPEFLLGRVKQLLKPDGSLMLLCASLDSWAARFFRGKWWEFCKENLFYFDVNTLQNLLVKVGFSDPIIVPDYRNISLTYAQKRAQDLQRSFSRKVLSAALLLTPGPLKYLPFRFFDSRMLVFSRPSKARKIPKLSVIVPVFNEKATFSQMIEVLLAKEIPNVNIEIVIVESNSTDGSREDVLKCQEHPRVKVVLEDKPRGKGFAVRTGLANVTGDIILIQDADLEYDINDYDALVEPIMRYQQSFVIGSRHLRNKQTWKVREFNDAPVLSSFFNLGHLVFLTLFNVFYRQSLVDPFSMFKVFRRECLYGLNFECNRFDFDFEIVIKFLRKGYKPVEIPVNYRARSLQEGKKVSMFRDPLTWLRALIKFRFSPLYEKGETPSKKVDGSSINSKGV